MELENNYPFPCIMEVADHRFSPKYRTFICITRDLPSKNFRTEKFKNAFSDAELNLVQAVGAVGMSYQPA